MRKPILLAFLGLSCMIGPPPPPPPVAGMKLDPTVKGLAYDANPGGTEDFTLTIENTGDFAFDWDAFPESAWLTCVPDTGSLLETESAVVTVTIDLDHVDVVDGLNATNLRVEWSEGADRYIRVSVYIDGGQGWTIVDGVGGDDGGDGSAASPYKTITKGMEAAVSIYAVVCLPATYEEVVTLGEGLTLVGTGPQGCVIDAGTGPSLTASAAVSSATTLSGFTITGGDPAVTDGAAMTCEGSPVVTDCEFSSCRGSQNAAVFLKGDSGATFSDCVVKSNSGCHGIACFDNSSPTISNCEISNNYYSGVWCGGSSSPVIEFCEIASNPFSGVYVAGFALPVIDANTIKDNGQGIVLWGNSDAIVTNNVIMDSTGTPDGDVGYGLASAASEVTSATATITNNTIVANEEGIFWGSNGSWILENNIVYFNSALEVSFNVEPSPYGYNCIQYFQTGGTNNFGVSPRFENYDERDLRLKLLSSCRDEGDDGATSLPTHDIAGNARIMGAQVDRGAYEYVE